MRTVFLITYDLRSDRDYSDLYDAIQGAEKWWHFLESTWMIATTDSAEEWRERLLPHIDESDSILIIEVGSQYQGWLPTVAWDWIRDNLAATHSAVPAGSTS